MVLAEQYLRMDEKDEARENLELAIQANAELAPARELLSGLLLESGELDRVFAVLDPLVKHGSDRFEVLTVLGQAHFQRQEYAKSAELLEKALTLRRPDPQLLNVLASAQHQLGNDSRALELLERSLSLNPEQPTVKQLLEALKVGTTGPR